MGMTIHTGSCQIVHSVQYLSFPKLAERTGILPTGTSTSSTGDSGEPSEVQALEAIGWRQWGSFGDSSWSWLLLRPASWWTAWISSMAVHRRCWDRQKKKILPIDSPSVVDWSHRHGRIAVYSELENHSKKSNFRLFYIPASKKSIVIELNQQPLHTL